MTMPENTDLPNFGWITPMKRIVSCGKYGHLEAMLSDDELRKLIPEFSAWKSSLESARQTSEDLIAAGEHPEWHDYEMLQYDIDRSSYRALIDAGCIRIGRNYETEHCFEGRSQRIADCLQFIQELCGDEKPNITMV